jgi:hypothetical protein
VLGEQVQQRLVASDIVIDTQPGQQAALGVDDGDIVVVFGPVDSTGHTQFRPPRFGKEPWRDRPAP